MRYSCSNPLAEWKQSRGFCQKVTYFGPKSQDSMTRVPEDVQQLQ